MTTDNERLIRDVLRDEGYAQFRDDLRHKALAEFRRSRATRRSWWLPLAACVPIAAAIYWMRQPQPPAPPPITGVTIVRSAPMKKEQIITTAGYVASLSVMRSSEFPSAATIIRSDPALMVQSLTDDELLSLFPGQPVALVTLSDGARTLFFPDADEFRSAGTQ
jgi:hypothetical protein